LVGKRIGIPLLEGASYIGFRALLHAAGMQEQDVVLDTIGFNQVETLVAGQEEAVVVYANNEPLQLEARGHPVNLIRVADYVSLASNGLLTNEATLSENPELIRSMVRATLRGIADTIADPTAAFEICKQYVEGLDQLSAADQALQRRILDASIEFWKADQPGYSDPQAWQNMQELLLAMGLLAEPLDLAAAFSNEYLP
jgi:NitT/TauT family transport system substrate-binding protein